MATNKVNMEVLDDVRVKNEPICDSQSISQTKQENKVKEEPIDVEIQSSKPQIEVKAELEEKYSAREEFTYKTSIAFLNEQTNTNKLPKSK